MTSTHRSLSFPFWFRLSKDHQLFLQKNKKGTDFFDWHYAHVSDLELVCHRRPARRPNLVRLLRCRVGVTSCKREERRGPSTLKYSLENNFREEIQLFDSELSREYRGTFGGKLFRLKQEPIQVKTITIL